MERRSDALVDVMRVPVDGDPAVAVVPVGNLADARVIECDVLVVGGGTGGVAAALAAARRGQRVHLIEETDWIGGQLTAQGVSALDEHEHIEAFGGTASYYQLRNALRDHYRPLAGEAGKTAAFQSGQLLGHARRLRAEGRRGRDDGASPTAHRRRAAHPASARPRRLPPRCEDDRIVSVTAVGLEDGAAIQFRPAVVLDATELGDLLPLVGSRIRRRRRDHRRDGRGACPAFRAQAALRPELHLRVRA